MTKLFGNGVCFCTAAIPDDQIWQAGTCQENNHQRPEYGIHEGAIVSNCQEECQGQGGDPGRNPEGQAGSQHPTDFTKRVGGDRRKITLGKRAAGFCHAAATLTDAP